MNNLSVKIIVPAGDTKENLIRTVESIETVKKEKPWLDLEVFVVLNNGLVLPSEIFSDYSYVNMIDINPIASRAQARNRGLDLAVMGKASWITFLDSGDELVEGGLDELREKIVSGESKINNFDLISCGALIRTEAKLFHRTNKNIRLIKFINPFFLGSMYVNSSILGENLRFREGRKEDWKFWCDVLSDSERTIFNVQSPNYIYNVKSKINHAQRKVSLFKDQMSFFRNYLKVGKFESYCRIAVHYLLHIYYWFVLSCFEKNELHDRSS